MQGAVFFRCFYYYFKISIYSYKFYEKFYKRPAMFKHNTSPPLLH
uniref:Uncharacterized protein n=2 Tax=Anguilla anguilla TaxID=7936 RepID=A0A0E9U3N1_ANGAN